MRTKYLVVGVFLFLLITVGVGIGSVYQSRIDVDDAQALQGNQGDELRTDEENLPDTNGGETSRIANPGEQLPVSGTIQADVFSGTLEEVNTGCFADGECYVVVDGKHVTVLRGWSQETVGSVQGVDGFGDLESHIGEQVEVSVHALPNGTYTLYGSEGFYIKLLGGSTSGDAGADGSGGQGISVGEPNPSAPQPITSGGCMVGGCSGQLCVDAKTGGDMVTTCEYRAEYACYQVATCERQADGQCGWTMTPELNQCLNDTENQPVEAVY